MKKLYIIALVLCLFLLASCVEKAPEHVCSFPENGEIILEPTCLEAGKMIYVCSCGEQMTEELPIIGHDYRDGFCSVCNKQKPSEGLKMKLIDKSYYSVSRLGDCTDKDLIIPDTYEGLPVLQIERNAFLRADIESVTLPASIKTIKPSAFAQCESLKSVYINDLAAFMAIDFEVDKNSACKSNPLKGADLYLGGELITDLAVPAGTVVAPYAFTGCTSIRTVTFAEGFADVGEYAFAGCPNLEILRFSSTVEIVGRHAFDDCAQIKEVHAASIESWCGIEFSQRNSTNKEPSNPMEYTKTLLIDGKPVTDLVIPGSVSEVKPYTFNGCETLRTVILEEGVKAVGYAAFSACYQLEEITLPSTLKMIEGWGFERENLKRVNIKDIESFIVSTEHYTLLTNDNELYLNGELVTSVRVPYGIERLGYSFTGYSYLTEITFSDGIKVIGSNALSKTGITSIELPESVTSIEGAAFAGCEKLYDVNLPSSLESIGAGAFMQCSSLTSLLLPIKITEIPENLFTECRRLKSISIYPSVKEIELSAFMYTNISDIHFYGTEAEWEAVNIKVLDAMQSSSGRWEIDIKVHIYVPSEETK